MANLSLFRFFRFLRSMCAPITACIGFSALLTFIFILYQPDHGPGISQKMGWQAWESISPSDAILQTTQPSTSTGTGALPEGVDWWNVTTPGEGSADSASLPLDVWAPLMPHDTGCM